MGTTRSQDSHCVGYHFDQQYKCSIRVDLENIGFVFKMMISRIAQKGSEKIIASRNNAFKYSCANLAMPTMLPVEVQALSQTKWQGHWGILFCSHTEETISDEVHPHAIPR